MEFENELDKLRYMLDKAGVLYDSIKEEYSKEIIELHPDYYKGNNRYFHNQIIYGANNDLTEWKIDGICQMGSYGAKEGLIETYGPLGADAEGDPLVLYAKDVFDIIMEDWVITKEKKEKKENE